MGYTYRNNGQITDFWPDNTGDELYLEDNGGITVVDLLGEIHMHFGECDLEQIEVSSENIHTNCLTYDLHDSSDYTQFVVIRRIK